MAIPSKLPEWDTTQVNIVEVDQQHKDEGWIAPGGIPEKPPFQSFNWWQNLVYQWVLRFKNITGGLDNITQLLSFPETVDGTSVNVRGYATRDDGGGDIFNYNSTIDKSTANGGTIIDPGQTLANQGTGVGNGCWVRQYKGKVNIKDFGAIGDGVTDDTVAIQSCIDFAAIASGDNVLAAVFIPAGSFVCTSAITVPDKVSITGESPSSAALLINHTGYGLTSEAAVDKRNIYLKDFMLISTTAARAIYAEGWIRNCGLENIYAVGFDYGFYFKRSWTQTLTNCFVSNSNISHVYGASDVGGFHIYGGRYDVAESYGIHIQASAGELLMSDAAVQFGKKSAVRTEDCYTTVLMNCFFEGNCIGSTTDYYVEIIGNGNSLSSAVVDNCVMNNLADSNRDGLGVCYVDAIDDFKYKERWTRNGVSAIPIVGTTVKKVDAHFSNATDRSPLLISNEANSEYVANISQTARPAGIFGRDMTEVSFSPTTYAALNVGRDNVGVAIGTYDGIGTVQCYGAGSDLKINPGSGDITFGQSNASLAIGTNEWFGRYRESTQLTSSNITPNSTTGYLGTNCTDGGRSVTLTNILASAGRRVTIGKTDGTTNNLTITPDSGLINGASDYTLNTAYQHVTLISNGTDWFVL